LSVIAGCGGLDVRRGRRLSKDCGAEKESCGENGTAARIHSAVILTVGFEKTLNERMRLSTEPVDLFPECSPFWRHSNSGRFLGQFPDVVFDRLLQGFAHLARIMECALSNLVLDRKNDVHWQSMWQCRCRVNVAN